MLTAESIEWKDVFNAIGHPSCIFDTEFNIISINTAASRLLKKSEDEVRGAKCYKLFHGIDEPIEGCPLKRMISSGRFETMEVEIAAFNGVFLVSCSPLYDNDGNIVKVIHIATDITGRKCAEKDLAESEGKYRSFVRNFQGIAFRGNMDFTPIFFHGSVGEITGYTEEEFIKGRPRWDQLIYPGDVAKLKSSIEKVRNVPGYSIEREYRIMHKNGQIRWVNEHIKNICDSSGKPAYVHGVIYDITERRKTEEALGKAMEKIEELNRDLENKVEIRTQELKRSQAQLIQTEKLSVLGQLAAGLAHELNSPLAGLLPLIAKYREKQEKGSGAYNEMTLMLDGCVHMAKIVKDFSLFTKASKGEYALLELNTVIDDTLSFCSMQYTHKGIRIIREYADKLPGVLGDKIKLQQIVLNMITNAVDAMPDGGRLIIRTYIAGDKGNVVMEFIDNGRGISGEDINKIFDPFFTTKAERENVGLGLYVSLGIIKEHGGDISVESEPGRGTKFTVSLPVAGGEGHIINEKS